MTQSDLYHFCNQFRRQTADRQEQWSSLVAQVDSFVSACRTSDVLFVSRNISS